MAQLAMAEPPGAQETPETPALLVILELEEEEEVAAALGAT